MKQHIEAIKDRQRQKLPDHIELAVGMKAMIELNIATDADMANGTRGTIEGIVLDSREEALHTEEDGSIKLRYPPALILFKLEGGSPPSSTIECNLSESRTAWSP